MTVTLLHGDCLELLPTLDANSVDTVITDPPYGLEFMGKDWDHGVPGVAYWEAALRVAKPGAMLLAFGGTRTHHRLMCVIEDAGWEIRDCLMWLYGQGFPKSKDISKAIDKAAGAEREVVGLKQYGDNGQTYGERKAAGRAGGGIMGEPCARGSDYQTAPATPAAQLWDGYGTALKPAWEIIILAMKPRDGTFANNALEYGVAGLWVDGGRIGTAADMNPRDFDDTRRTAPKFSGTYNGGEVGQYLTRTGAVPNGRWPANLILSHNPDCRRVGVRKVASNERKRKGIAGRPKFNGVTMMTYNNAVDQTNADPDGLETVDTWECTPGCAVAMLDEQSGALAPGGSRKNRQTGRIFVHGGEHTQYDNGGGASRFFYCAKASRSERTCNGTVECNHPTVKPLSLMRYLVRLTKTPTGGTVLDPFMGSGSTGVASILEGRDFIGMDNDIESFTIATGRTDWAQNEIVQLGLEETP